MTKVIVSFLFLVFFGTSLAESRPDVEKSQPTLCSFMQIQSFLYRFRHIKSNRNAQTGSKEQAFTAAPELKFCIPIGNYVIRPSLSWNPFESDSEGSLKMGRRFGTQFEAGLYAKLNYDRTSLGSGNSENEQIETNFAIGPYGIYYPFIQKDMYLELNAYVAYGYVNEQFTTNGTWTRTTDKRGMDTSFQILYAIRASDKIFYTPHVQMNYLFYNDAVGDNINENIYEAVIVPISFRVSL